MNNLSILGIILVTLISIYGIVYLGYKKIYIPSIRLSSMSFDECISTLNNIILYELQLNADDILNSSKLTNKNFVNFYTTLSTSIMENLSDELIVNFKVFITEDYLYTIILRTVKRYLIQQVEVVN